MLFFSIEIHIYIVVQKYNNMCLAFVSDGEKFRNHKRNYKCDKSLL